MSTFYIYGLADERHPNRIRYVGQSHNPQRRFRQHASAIATACPLWTLCLRLVNRKPVMSILETIHGERPDALKREDEWIRRIEDSTGCLANDAEWVKRCNAAGVPVSVRESYHSLIKTLYLLRLHPSEDATVIRHISRVVDALATEWPVLNLLGGTSDFATALWDAKHFPWVRRHELQEIAFYASADTSESAP